MLIIEQLTKQFGATPAVDRVSLQIPKGQMLGIIGRSGAGKSTLLRLINRLSEPSHGRILCDGDDITRLRGRALRRWRANCAMIFQQFNLVGRLDVLTNVLLGRLYRHDLLSSLFGWFDDAQRLAAICALDRIDIAQTALQRAEMLSGGQQQRVAIARALMQEPKILLADEPIASLDPRNAKLVMDALKRLNREDGLTVICNLHTLDTARAYCDRIVGMQEGRLVFDGAPEDLGDDQAREIYGVHAFGEAFHEAITSTAIGRPRRDVATV